MLAYHFSTLTLRDGRPWPAIGAWLEHAGPLIPWDKGLHGSEHPFDALTYAPGLWLHRVELAGEMLPHGQPPNMWVARRLRRLATVDATSLLWDFARWCALQVLPLWEAPPVVHEYLTTGNDELRAAALAAAKASWDTAVEATLAAWAATWATWATWASTAAGKAHWDTTTWEAARAAQRAQLLTLVEAAFAPQEGWR
jgi:hypothetical protein